MIHTGANTPSGVEVLKVPYWALPFDELARLTMGEMQALPLGALRDRVAAMKRKGAKNLKDAPPEETITADTPVPFSIRQLWFELETLEQRVTYEKGGEQTEENKCTAEDEGDAATLRPPIYPAAAMGPVPPFLASLGLPIGRQLDLLHSRLRDSRFSFMFDPEDPLHPNLDGEIEADLDSLLRQWVGGTRPVTVLDVSGIPPRC